MPMTDKNIIIKFIDREVDEVYKKYSNISAEEANRVGKFVDRIDKENLNRCQSKK